MTDELLFKGHIPTETGPRALLEVSRPFPDADNYEVSFVVYGRWRAFWTALRQPEVPSAWGEADAYRPLLNALVRNGVLERQRLAAPAPDALARCSCGCSVVGVQCWDGIDQHNEYALEFFGARWPYRSWGHLWRALRDGRVSAGVCLPAKDLRSLFHVFDPDR